MLRRTFTLALTLAPAASAFAERASPYLAIEAAVHGRLGVAILDSATGQVDGWRLDERFPMCSTFKWLLAAAVLKRVDAGQDALAERIVYAGRALPAYSPVSSLHADARGLSVGELCQAAVELSDNGAANLLLARLGGPPAVTAIARTLGDRATRLDRDEPTLNESRPGDPRDTTTPRAMTAALREAVLGRALSEASRAQLLDWLVATRTGLKRLRGGLPADWRAGDKTGTGARGSTNDVAIVWPPGRAPLLVAAYLTASPAPIAQREATLAQVGREVARRFGVS